LVGAATADEWYTAANCSPSGMQAASDAASISGKSVNLSSNATFASLTLTSGASLAVASNGGRVLRTSALLISSDSTLNLNDNALILDYSGVTPMTDVLARIVEGRGGSPAGIYSAQANASGGALALGIAEASDVLGLTGSQTGLFTGQTVDATTVLVKYTLIGDANLDGRVDFDDLVRLAQHYNMTGRTWADGDFTGDGKVDFNDLVKLAQNYNASVPGTAPASPAPLFTTAFAAAFAPPAPTPSLRPVPPKPVAVPKPKPATRPPAQSGTFGITQIRRLKEALELLM